MRLGGRCLREGGSDDVDDAGGDGLGDGGGDDWGGTNIGSTSSTGARAGGGVLLEDGAEGARVGGVGWDGGAARGDGTWDVGWLHGGAWDGDGHSAGGLGDGDGRDGSGWDRGAAEVGLAVGDVGRVDLLTLPSSLDDSEAVVLVTLVGVGWVVEGLGGDESGEGEHGGDGGEGDEHCGLGLGLVWGFGLRVVVVEE